MTTLRTRLLISFVILTFASVSAYLVVRPSISYGASMVTCNYFGSTDGYMIYNTMDFSAFQNPACPVWVSFPYTDPSLSYSCSYLGGPGGGGPGSGPEIGSLCNFSISVVDPSPACSPLSGTSCSTPTNMCSQATFGTWDCTGTVCSAGSVAPAVVDACPSSGGVQCSVSDPGPGCTQSSVCGSNSGTTLCDGSCSVSAPTVPATYGNTCSRSNSCGSVTNWGTIDCSSSCNATPPSEASCGTGLPDLTAGNPIPTAATAGTAKNFTVQISNIGSATTGSGFTSLIQKANDSSGSGAADVGTFAVATIANGGSIASTFSYTFPVGDGGTTKYLRVCADKSSAADSTGTIAEGSGEGNNCGAWTAVVVAPSGGGPSVSCTPGTQVITMGGTATWTANPGGTAGPTYKWYDPANTLLGTGITFSKLFSAAGVYAVHVTANDGGSGIVTSSDCQVTVSGGTCDDSGPVKVVANPSRVESGKTSTLTVTGANVSAACTLIGPGVNTPITPISGTCSLTGAYTTPVLTNQAVYTLTCPGGQTSKAIVNVVPKIQEI